MPNPGTYRLSSLVRMPGGRTLAELLSRADANLASVKDETLARLDAAMASLKHQAAAGRIDVMDAHQAAMVVSELGATAGYAPVGSAAQLLCDWIELASEKEAALRMGMALHVDAMAALRRAPPGSKDGGALLGGLKDLARQWPAAKA